MQFLAHVPASTYDLSFYGVEFCDKLVLAVGTKPFQKGFDRLVSAFSVAVVKQPG